MSIEKKIQQFKQMAEADPENELGHFSLGKAYVEAGRHAEAIAPFTRALQLNPTLSKVYQLLGEAYEQTGRRGQAIETLTRGAVVADEQGDRMPRDSMAAMLRELGAPVPTFRHAVSTGAAFGAGGASASGFSCSRCGRPHGQLEKPPFKGPLGERVFKNVCASCWREWIPMGTKVINELGLALTSPAAQETYDQYMIEFLQLEDR
jgi:Fe-S cluster biosynthesis and repair protein YggX/DNA-binding SARP family transcriptional activator